jgi:MFS transporter, DHA1 family, inner membrane transport protein
LAPTQLNQQHSALDGKREEKQIQDQGSTTSPAAVGATTEPRGVNAAAIGMYCVLLAAYSLMAADRYLFPVLAPDVQREFGFSLSHTGLLSTIFTLGLGIGGLPTGYLLSHYRRKAVLLLGIAIFSGATALTTIATGFWTLLICLAATGIGMAMLATAMFALAASYFVKYRAAAIGSVNFCYGLGGFYGPIMASVLLTSYATWRAPMIGFGAAGFVMIALILLTVRSWFSETHRAAVARHGVGGAPSLRNRNTVLLTLLSIIHGLALYGFLGMYPTFLRESLHYAPKAAGGVMSFFGLGALLSIIGGWVGDRISPRVVMSGGFLCTAVLGFLFFQQSGSTLTREILTFAYGGIGSSILYVNLAGYHVKAVKSDLASKGSGMFVTSLYGSSAAAGYLMGAIVSHSSWLLAGEIQMTLFAVIGAVLALALRPEEMAL